MLFVGALNALVVFLALAVLLRQVGDWNVKVWATTLQFLGMLVASGGLLYAYRRAKKARPVVVRPGPAHLFRCDVSTLGTAPFRLDRTASPEAQLVQLEDFVNGVLVERFASMSGRIDELRHELKVARTLAESSALKALADIETKIEKLTAELNKIRHSTSAGRSAACSSQPSGRSWATGRESPRRHTIPLAT